MRKYLFFALALMFSFSVMGQQTISLRSVDRAECVSSDYQQLRASFSFSTIEAENMETQRGQFSWLSMANTVMGGNEGDPQIPVVNELIAVPFGANPTIRVTSYSTTDYQLNDLGIQTLIPRQPSLRKDQHPEDVPFVYNEAAYQSNRSFRSEPMAVVNVVGTMRGVQLGKMTIEPVSYDPVSNTLRVFNDIEVEVSFDGADAQATEQLLVDTYSPYFDGIYSMLFNGRAVRDAYSQHPDLYTTPVKMLVVTTSTYVNSTPFQNWLTWKKQKGINVDVQTVANNASASTIKNLIYSRYNANHPTFLVIVGDETVVTCYRLWDYDSSYGNAASDLEYASVDGDVYHDMFISRIPVSSTTELSNYVNKALTYEKYTMSDPSYLSNVLLIAGADNTWAPRVGRPTINYAADNYFNTAHGFTNVYKYVTNSYSGCYNYLSSGVGFANYTAHGDIQEWYSPNFTNSDVNNLTNNDKYFWAMGNCCLTCNFKNAQNNQVCFGEVMIRVANKGAFGYIGSVPESYWYEDYYFGVGATSVMSQTPSMSQTSLGVYDMMFDDTQMNTLNSVPFAGNVAVTYAHANSYTSSVSDEYYWRAYQCFGDGSIMPYHTQPVANNVSHASTISLGTSSFTVNADAGSYVSITKNNEILGVAQVGSTGTVEVPVSGLTSVGDVMIVVTRQQRQPYIQTIDVVGGTLYNLSYNATEHGSISGPEQAYGTALVTLTATPETGYCLSAWDVRDANNNSITVTDNQFVMPNSNVTVSATFIPGMQVTLASVMNGTISADPTCALQGTTINLTATPATGYNFDSWIVYKTGDVNTTVTVTNNSFTMPNYDVTVCALFSENLSGDVTIGSGTSSNGYIPTFAYYNYTLSQQIYTSSEMGDAGTITKVAFKVSNSKSTSRNIEIYLSHTTKSSFSSTSDWVSQGTSYRVFSGDVTFSASGWTTITLDTPFEYNGTSNLLLTVDDNTGSYVSSSSKSPKFYVYSTNDYTALYKYNDDTNYNPASMSASGTRLQTNNQVVFTKELPSNDAYLSVSSNALSGFTYAQGEGPSLEQSIAIIGRNLSSNLSVTMPTGYEVSSDGSSYASSLSLTPANGNLQQMLYVRLKASLSQGTYNGTMTLTSTSTTTSVTLNGEVTEGNGPVVIEQTVPLSVGWNWWSSYIELSDIDGLGLLENSIGVPKAIIQSKDNGYVKSGLRNGSVVWRGELSSINNEEMYKIGTKVACYATIVGHVTTPSDHPITINKGWNWIGFPCSQSVSVNEALSAFTPKNGDVIKGIHSYATYSNGTWSGTLNTLEPGQGYMYGSRSNAPKTLVFQSGRDEAIIANITPESNYYQPTALYADNMTIIAVVELDGEELRTEDYELAAFAGDECRGSVKLMYVESINRYVAFLTVFGDQEEDLLFRLTDGVASILSSDHLAYAIDGISGELANPVILHFGPMDVEENAAADVKVYPNPSEGMFNIEGQNIKKVEVFNSLGQPVYAKDTENGMMMIDLTNHAAGIYLIRIVTDNGIWSHQVIKK